MKNPLNAKTSIIRPIIEKTYIGDLIIVCTVEIKSEKLNGIE